MLVADFFKIYIHSNFNVNKTLLPIRLIDNKVFTIDEINDKSP